MGVTLNRIRAVSLGGNTSGALALVSTGTLFLAGGNNVTLSQNGQSVTISGGAGAGGFAGGGISGGNTAGDTGSVTGRLMFAGGNNITLSGSTNGGSMTITISGGAGAGGFAGGGISGGNTSGDTGSVTGRLIFAGTNNITLSGSTNAGSMTITVSGPTLTQYLTTAALSNHSHGNPTLELTNLSGTTDSNSAGLTLSLSASPHASGSFFTNGPVGGGINVLPIQASFSQVPVFNPWFQPYYMTWDELVIALSRSTTGSNAFTIDAGIYAFSDSTQITLVNSVRNVFSHTNTAVISGLRLFAITGLTNTSISALSPGFYVMGIKWSFGNTSSANYSLRANLQGIATGEIRPGTNQINTTNVSSPVLQFQGKYTTTTADLPGTVATSNMLHRYTGSSAPIDYWFMLKGSS